MAAVLSRLLAAQRSDRQAAEVPLAYLARLQGAFGAAAGGSDLANPRPASSSS